MGVETFRKTAAKKAGEMVERNTRLEIRVDFAKERLIPPVARFMKELSEVVKPIPSTIVRGLNPDMYSILDGAVLKSGGELNVSGVMNLGGINIKCSPMSNSSYLNLLVGFRPNEEIISIFACLRPKIDYPQDLWDACSIVVSKEIPRLKLKDGTTAPQGTFKAIKSDKREINVLEAKAPWPMICSEEFYSYLSAAWALVADTSFDLIGE